MMTVKLTCGHCGWDGYKHVDGRTLRHHLTCPACKNAIALCMTPEDVVRDTALSLSRRAAFTPPPLPRPGRKAS